MYCSLYCALELGHCIARHYEADKEGNIVRTELFMLRNLGWLTWTHAEFGQPLLHQFKRNHYLIRLITPKINNAGELCRI